MPADPLANVSPGDALSDTIGRASVVNAILEQSRKVRDGLPRQAPKEGRGPVPAVEIFVRNDTGAGLEAFSVLAIQTTTVVDPSSLPFEVQARPAFAGAAPAAVTDPFCVLSEPVADDAWGRAVLLGVTVVAVNLTSGHGYASPAVGDTSKLASNLGGPARILWSAAGSGSSVRCVVELTGAWPIKKQRIVTQIGCNGSTIQYTYKDVWVVDLPV